MRTKIVKATWIAARPRPVRREIARTASPRAALASLVVVLALSPLAASAVVRARRTFRRESAYFRSFRSLVDSIPEQRAIVFVRYRPDHFPHHSLIDNDPDLAAAKTWIVYDRGPENALLVNVAAGRVPYLYDEASERLTRLPARSVGAT